jgi:hypothetical protein
MAHGLVDFPPDVLTPTWRNGRVGLESITKRLDRFFISESLATVDGQDQILGGHSPYLSDHTPIFLQFGSPAVHFSYPFKLNSCWLVEEGFIAIVNVVWKDPIFQLEKQVYNNAFIWKMKHLKSHIKRWATQHKRHTLHKLHELEQNLKIYTKSILWMGTQGTGINN